MTIFFPKLAISDNLLLRLGIQRREVRLFKRPRSCLFITGVKIILVDHVTRRFVRILITTTIQIPSHEPPPNAVPTLAMTRIIQERLKVLQEAAQISQQQLNRIISTICIQLNYPENLVGLEGKKKHHATWDAWFDGFIDPMLDAANIGGREVFWNVGDRTA